MKRISLMLLLLFVLAGCGKPAAPVVTDPPAPQPAPPLAELWPGVPEHPGRVDKETLAARPYLLQIQGVGPDEVLTWYQWALAERGWQEREVTGHRVRLFERDGLFLSVAAYPGAVLLHRRSSIHLAEEEALEAARRAVSDPQAVVEWRARFDREFYPQQGETAVIALVVAAVHPAGNKTLVHVDAITGAAFRVTQVEPGEAKPITAEEAIAIVKGMQALSNHTLEALYLEDHGAWKVIITPQETKLSYHVILDAFSGRILGGSSPRSGQ